MSLHKQPYRKNITTYGRFTTIVMPLLTFIVIIGIVGLQLLHLGFVHAASKTQVSSHPVSSTLLVPGALSRSRSDATCTMESGGEHCTRHQNAMSTTVPAISTWPQSASNRNITHTIQSAVTK